MIPLPRSREGAAQSRRRLLGVIGGPHPSANADFLLKILQAVDQRTGPDQLDLLVEEPAGFDQLSILDAATALAARGVTSVVLPSFESLEFLCELRKYSPLPIADMLEAVVEHVGRAYPGLRRIGVLTSESLRQHEIFEPNFFQAGAADERAKYPAHLGADQCIDDDPHTKDRLRRADDALGPAGIRRLQRPRRRSSSCRGLISNSFRGRAGIRRLPLENLHNLRMYGNVVIWPWRRRRT